QHATMSGNASKIKSDGPYGGGVSDSHDVNGPVTIQSVAGVDLEFGNSGNHPDGEIIITKINNPPNTNPDGSPTTGSYWIINNYGSSSTITSLNSLTFHDLDNTIPISQASDFSLSNRPPNSHSNNWTAYETGDVLDTNNKQITFNGGLANTDLGQFTISNTAAKGWIGVVSTSWDDPQNWGEGVIPAINAHVIIPPGTPFVPLVNMHTTIKSLTLMEGAVLNVENGKIFQVGN
ncbi:MAG: hypothetical protein HKN68_13725, partial [Saprospiraceae bacterium]|nr:hypothetical protein [Saprospiraceae bacterium]